MMGEVFAELCEALVSSHKTFKKLEKKIDKDRIIMGSQMPEEQVARYDRSKQHFERLYSSASSFAECLGVEVPLLEEEKDEALAASSGDFAGLDDKDKAINLYGDSESKAFYEDIPDLLNTVPLAALGITAEQALALKEEWRIKRESILSMTNEDNSPPPPKEDATGIAEEAAGPAPARC